MGWKGNKPDRTKPILALATLAVAIAAIFTQLYINYPSVFIVKIYPDTEIHVCAGDGGFTLDQSIEVAHGVYKMAPSSIETNNKGDIEFVENVSVTDIEGPWWNLWRVVKPYRDQVTLTALNGPPGVSVTFINTPFSAGIQDTSTMASNLPINSKIILTIAHNATLSYGPHYITIKGIGQDEKTESTCTCVLKVGQSCGQNRFIVIKNFTSLSNIGHISISNVTISSQ